MTNLEMKRVQLELLRVTTARYELELKIEERLEEINRLKDHVKVQSDKEKELTHRINILKDK